MIALEILSSVELQKLFGGGGDVEEFDRVDKLAP